MSNQWWSSLRPFEQRVAVVFASSLFLVANYWFVFPHFSDYTKFNVRLKAAEEKLKRYREKVALIPEIEQKILALEGGNADVPAEDQTFHFASTVESHATQAGVNIITRSREATRTNQFFLERSQVISVQSGEQQLLDFIYSLGDTNSQIRVRDLSLHPDQPRQNLAATVKLVASYQKKGVKIVRVTATETPVNKAPSVAANPPPAEKEKQKPTTPEMQKPPAVPAMPVPVTSTAEPAAKPAPAGEGPTLKQPNVGRPGMTNPAPAQRRPGSSGTAAPGTLPDLPAFKPQRSNSPSPAPNPSKSQYNSQ